MKNKKILNFILAAALAAGFACKKKEAREAPAQTAPEQTITAAVKANKIAPGYIRKDTYFKLPDIKGGNIDLASYSGKPVLLMFFTETCTYCRKAAPFIERVYLTYAKKGLNVAGICIQDDSGAPKAFARDLAITFPLAYEGRHVYKDYRAQGVPVIYLLDKTHEINEFWGGYSPEYEVEIIERIEQILK